MFKKLYCYAKPDQMIDHQYTDDVAICLARNKKKAFKVFSRYYGFCTKKDIFEIHFIKDKGYVPIAILTDY